MVLLHVLVARHERSEGEDGSAPLLRDTPRPAAEPRHRSSPLPPLLHKRVLFWSPLNFPHSCHILCVPCKLHFDRSKKKKIIRSAKEAASLDLIRPKTIISKLFYCSNGARESRWADLCGANIR